MLNILHILTFLKVQFCPIKLFIGYIVLSKDNELFIIEHKGNIKNIINDLNIKFKINIHEKQIVNVMHKHKKNINSFFKITPIIEEFV